MRREGELGRREDQTLLEGAATEREGRRFLFLFAVGNAEGAAVDGGDARA
jgi:hypothetical protein